VTQSGHLADELCDMPEPQKTPWKRIGIEASAIVASILLAFAIDAWWSERQEEADERELLSSLSIEFQTLQEDVNWRLRYIEGIRDAGRTLLRESSSASETISDQEIDQLLNHIVYHSESAPLAMPVLNSALASGEFTLISARELRSDLSLWPERLERARNNVDRDIEFYTERLMPFLSRNASLAQTVMAITHIPGHPNEVYEGEVSIEIDHPVSHRTLLVHPEFQNLLIERDILLTGVLGLGYSVLDEELDATLSMINAELAN